MGSLGFARRRLQRAKLAWMAHEMAVIGTRPNSRHGGRCVR